MKNSLLDLSWEYLSWDYNINHIIILTNECQYNTCDTFGLRAIQEEPTNQVRRATRQAL